MIWSRWARSTARKTLNNLTIVNSGHPLISLTTSKRPPNKSSILSICAHRRQYTDPCFPKHLLYREAQLLAVQPLRIRDLKTLSLEGIQSWLRAQRHQTMQSTWVSMQTRTSQGWRLLPWSRYLWRTAAKKILAGTMVSMRHEPPKTGSSIASQSNCCSRDRCVIARVMIHCHRW